MGTNNNFISFIFSYYNNYNKENNIMNYRIMNNN